MTAHATMLGLKGEALHRAIAKVGPTYGEDPEHVHELATEVEGRLLLGEQLVAGWTAGA